jgi:excisionase family DNA binding protein
MLRLLGGTDAGAAHVAAALARHRRDMRLEGSAVPEWLDELERVFATVALGPRGSTRVQVGSEIGDPADPTEPDHELVTRQQAAKRLRCSTSTLKRRERAGELVPVRNGRLVRYRTADLDDYMTRSSGC